MIHDPERERLRTELRALLDSARGDTRADLRAWAVAKDYLESLFALEDFHIAARKAEAEHA